MNRELAIDLNAVGALDDDHLRRIEILCSRKAKLTRKSSMLDASTRR
jgi:hypothetical protein